MFLQNIFIIGVLVFVVLVLLRCAMMRCDCANEHFYQSVQRCGVTWDDARRNVDNTECKTVGDCDKNEKCYIIAT